MAMVLVALQAKTGALCAPSHEQDSAKTIHSRLLALQSFCLPELLFLIVFIYDYVPILNHLPCLLVGM